MLLRCCAACPPPGSRRATAHRSARFVSILASAFCPPYDSARAEHALVAALDPPVELFGEGVEVSADERTGQRHHNQYDDDLRNEGQRHLLNLGQGLNQ